MNKTILNRLILIIISIVLYFGLMYFWVEERSLSRTIHSTIVYFIIFSIIKLVSYLRKKYRK